MKSAFCILAALTAVTSALADTAKLTTRNGIQTLSIEGEGRPGSSEPGVLRDLHSTLFEATNVLKVSRHPGASFYEGENIEGSSSCPAAYCYKNLKIIQKKDDRAVPGRGVQTITKTDDDTYEVRGDAAKEIYKALVDAGKKPRKSSSKMPTKSIVSDSYICTENPLGGLNYKCTLLINSSIR